MGGTTSTFKFPYPVGTDLVKDGDDAVKALADKLELVMPTVSVTPSGTSGSVGQVGAASPTLDADNYRTWIYIGTQTSNVNAQISISIGAFKGWAFASCTGRGASNQNALIYVIDSVNSTAGNVIFYCYSPTTGALQPSRSCPVCFFVAGW